MSNVLTHHIVLKDGPIRGTPRDTDGILTFKGIPFAAPPVGPLRWKPPKPAEPWKEVLEATLFGASPWSAFQGIPAPTPQSEDCLTLNIWTSAQQQNEKLPVMVWIYGGGFQFGSSATPDYDGKELAKKGVIVVTFNYRVGPLGFLALPELDKEEHPSGNFGLQDQIAALLWVRNNISLFGGDPNNVTVFGESAGAHSIGLLMASPLAPGLFHKAILQSGAFWESEHGCLASYDRARALGLMLTKRLGVDSIAELRHLPAEVVTAAGSWDFNIDPGITAFGPSVDGYVVEQYPSQVFLKGRQMQVPIIAGWNALEDLPFRPRALPHKSTDEYKAAAKLLFGSRTPEFLSLYPGDTKEQAESSAHTFIGDMVITQQTWEAADHQRQAATPVFVYHFTYTSPYSPFAGHAADIAFTFATLKRNLIISSAPPAGGADIEFADRLTTYWTNFAKSSDPNEPNQSLPHWPVYAGGGADILELGNSIKQVNYPRDRFEFLRSVRDDGKLPENWLNDFTTSEENRAVSLGVLDH